MLANVAANLLLFVELTGSLSILLFLYLLLLLQLLTFSVESPTRPLRGTLPNDAFLLMTSSSVAAAIFTPSFKRKIRIILLAT